VQIAPSLNLFIRDLYQYLAFGARLVIILFIHFIGSNSVNNRKEKQLHHVFTSYCTAQSSERCESVSVHYLDK